MNKRRANHLLRRTATTVAAGLIVTLIPFTGNAAFAQGSYVNPDNYIEKSDAMTTQFKYTAIILAGVGVMSYINSVTQTSTMTATSGAASAADTKKSNTGVGQSACPCSDQRRIPTL